MPIPSFEGMCGKFTQMVSYRALHAQLQAFYDATKAGGEIETVTPMRFAS
jgi:hypothetical protein